MLTQVAKSCDSKHPKTNKPVVGQMFCEKPRMVDTLKAKPNYVSVATRGKRLASMPWCYYSCEDKISRSRGSCAIKTAHVPDKTGGIVMLFHVLFPHFCFLSLSSYLLCEVSTFLEGVVREEVEFCESYAMTS
jgi:hypothetical protein